MKIRMSCIHTVPRKIMLLRCQIAAFLKYSEKSGEKITPYQLRHSFATLFLKNGGDVFSLQHLMAHADLRTTKRYTELYES